MNKHYASGMLALWLVSYGTAFAAAPAAEPAVGLTAHAERCMQAVEKQLARQRFLYQAQLFGVAPAASAPAGSTRMDASGNTWLKNSQGQWTRETSDGLFQPLSDREMDAQTAYDRVYEPAGGTFLPQEPTHDGLLETQRAATSDLIPPILQTFRAFQCRVEQVCRGALLSLGSSVGDIPSPDLDPSAMRVELPGCEPLQMQPITACQVENGESAIDLVTAQSFCAPAAAHLIDYEMAQLSYIVHYDAAHRSIRQFAGFLEPFLDTLSFPVLEPLRQAATFLHRWIRLPCFLPYCSQNDQQ